MPRKAILILSLTFLLGPVPGTAHAATAEANCTLRTVGYNHDSTQRFIHLVCANNTVHIAYNTGGNCPAISIDTLKIWHSTALAAKLANKPVTIWWNSVTCAGTSPKRYISGIELTP